MAETELNDLADSELRRRLLQRGVEPDRAEALIRLRDEPAMVPKLRQAIGWDPT